MRVSCPFALSRILFTLAAAGCATAPREHEAPRPRAAPTDDVRVALNRLFSEHVWLAAAATGAALQQHPGAFAAAAAALDSNSVALADAVGTFHGATARDAFLPLWRRHIGIVVDYATAVGAKDEAKRDAAADDLFAYVADLTAFLHSAHPNLPEAALSALIEDHVATLLDVVDAQGAEDWPAAYTALRRAAAHMGAIADPLAADLRGER
jgi:hypothetical protein